MLEQNSRKIILRTIVKLMVMAALCTFIWVLSGSFPERDRDAVEAVRFNIADMQIGDHLLVEWYRKPLFIVYRKPEWEAALLSADAELYRDPDSKRSSQPETATNALRSSVNGWFVTLGLGTGTGCSLVISEPANVESATADSDKIPDTGGFIDNCDKSRYDLAGRVYRKQQAQRNTVIPEWSLVGSDIVVGG